VIGITLGDPAGIGPEILAKLLSRELERVTKICVPVVIGDARVVRQGLELVDSELDLEIVDDLDDVPGPETAVILDLKNISPDDYLWGRPCAEAGRASGQFIERAVQLALEGRIDAIVTNPINKVAFSLGGYGGRYAGHTEMLADLTGAGSTCMMLTCGELRVCHVTTHVSMLEAVTRQITRERIVEVIQLAHDACRRMGISPVTVGVAGLNPHAGEGGLFGEEEQREIVPAIEEARRSGLQVEGPVPADTLFSKALAGAYQVVVAMYHDQGHIPVKLLGFRFSDGETATELRGTNITLGLPIIRTSVDHGTAYDLAGQGVADHHSLLEALETAVKLAR
jgi:4-hydroxythreonine-4-phosphate dehydrogenase